MTAQTTPGALQLGLSQSEMETVRRTLGREPNETEWSIIDAEWSEHSSYKSSKALLRLFPTKGPRVVLGPGYDAGVVDVGGGYVITLHIESHNHPSAVDPYGGASTGIGGVLRDILSMGTRPVALVDVLRFGDISSSAHSRWLFRNVVRGIADYGNCTGVPTVAGEIEFDESFERNCLVDVACVGVGRREDLILGEARTPGDVLVLIGGSTGRDGIRGATFASKNLSERAEEDRSSVQVPDPFMKKLLLDALMEAVPTRLIRGMKDLGGGGLSTALSEIASSGGTGVDVELTRANLREGDMSPTEVMISESQERMLLVLSPPGPPSSSSSSPAPDPVLEILRKYGVPFSEIGRVTGDGTMTLRWRGEVVASLPASFVTRAPLIPWPSRPPSKQGRQTAASLPTPDAGRSLLSLMASPNLASRRWVYRQYDHEVGLRTVVKPGQADAALLLLPNGSLLAVKGDGNSGQCYLDPYHGAAGCVAEACRNVVAVGAEPAALVDHLQFGDPSDPAVYWSFAESVRGMADYCAGVGLPVVGGKVSFYNESSRVAIKPSPVALVVGLVDGRDRRHPPVSMGFERDGESVFVVGETREEELGGSEYHRLLDAPDSGSVPVADPAADALVYRSVLELIRSGDVGSVHDCSRGGLAVALAEMAVAGGRGATVDLGRVPLSSSPSPASSAAGALFSESHGRFVLAAGHPRRVARSLRARGVPFAEVGEVGGSALRLARGARRVAEPEVRALARAHEGTIGRLMA